MAHLSDTQELALLFLVVFLLIATWIAYGIYVSMRHKKLFAQSFPDEWEKILRKNVGFFHMMPESLQKQLEGLINIFLDEKRFEGCGGLEITDEIRVTIAAQACMLLLNRNTHFYPKLTFILVYPSAYVAKSFQPVGGSYIVNESQGRLGESWLRGSLVLAWDHVDQRVCDIHDGHNVVFHEFAHQLDQESGSSDGIPILEQPSSYAAWSRVFAHDYSLLRYEVEHHLRDVMDAYGATNPAEFFAVATETFFEKPGKLRRKHPELFEQMKNYYKLDPLEWQAERIGPDRY